ncbi:hypothetical protein KAR91_42255 [Candidatus Pacearchaeota archaeon]|nr:hypothetical protein [Candidatus Pacearchaeota archaeon]
MDTLKDFNDSYIKKVKAYYTRQKKVRKQIEALKAKEDSMRYPTFETVLSPIIELIKQKLKAKGHLIYGPFGLGCETTVYWVKDKKKEITVKSNVLGSLTFTRVGTGWGLQDRSVTTNKFPKGSIGEINGGNHLDIPIDDKMDMKWLLWYVRTN